MEECRHISTYS